MQGKCIVVMGVSGCGKSTVARLLADKANAVFIEGDSLHPPQNIEKMRRNIPLTDDDRNGWLHTIHSLIQQNTEENKTCIISCSALKRRYRAILRDGIENILFIYLQGTFELIHSLIAKRQHEFMSPALLKSQFETLEEPAFQEKDVITIPINTDINEEMKNIYKEPALKKFLEPV